MRALSRLARGLLAAVLALAPGAPAAAVDLVGSWHVLVHYKDSASENPELPRWDDRVWVFAREGDRLRWTEYPIVVFSDDSGRFERSSRQYARTLQYWEPNDGQLRQIRAGLEINERGSKSKTLRRADGKGWRSSGGSGAMGGNILSYSETWTVGDPDGLPLFRIEDSLSGPQAEGLEGATEYRTTEVESGDLLRGSFDRDGSRTGTFRLLRSGAVSEVEGSKNQAEMQTRLMRETGAVALAGDALRDLLIEEFAERQLDVPDAELDSIVAEYTRMLNEGVTADEIQRRMTHEVIPAALRKQFAFAKPDAVHDATARYRLPFDVTTPRQVTQGVGGVGFDGAAGMDNSLGAATHVGRQRYSFDFAMPVGTPVVAAREGTVVRVVDGYTQGGFLRSLAGKANVVMVEHSDGTVAVYAHLSQGAAVKKGQPVAAGDELALSGNTGMTSAPHLHFSVWTFDAKHEPSSVPIVFADAAGRDYTPVAPNYYGGPSGAAAK